jgi:sugar phosphate isomerase/epimerase
MPQPLALSTCWNADKHKDGGDILREARDLGFTSVELGHNTRYSLWPGLVQAAQQGIVRVGSLHNFCPVPLGVMRPNPNCYAFSDPRPELRRAAVSGSQDTIRHAADLGASLVILHAGWAGPSGLGDALEKKYEAGRPLDRSYVARKLDAVKKRRAEFAIIWPRVKACLDPLIELAREKKIKLGIECRESFEEFPNEEEFPSVLAELPEDVVGYWHDFGHAQRKEFLRWGDHAQMLRARRDRFLGGHVHDCLPPDRDHQPLGAGLVDFPRLLRELPEVWTAVLELSPRVSVEQVVKSREQWEQWTCATAPA